MAGQPIRLKYLLRERHWQIYRTFCIEYDKVADVIDPELTGTWPSRTQFHRWLSGDLKGLPYPDHCRILEGMLPGWTAAQMFEPVAGHAEQEGQAKLAAARATTDRLRNDRAAAARSPQIGALLNSDTTAKPVLAGAPSPPSPEVAVAVSQERWRAVRRYLAERGRAVLAHDVMRLYDPSRRVAGTPHMTPPGWLPDRPTPLENVTLVWQPLSPRPVITGRDEAELRPILPLRTPRQAFPSYTSAIRYLSPPRLFENRPSYRLLDVAGDTLTFGLTTYFDKLDVSEALTHEYAAAAMEGTPSWPRLPFRSLFTNPFDLSLRIAAPGINTLTIRRDTRDGLATFFLHLRDATKVVLGGGEYSVIPAGEFQPASISPDSMVSDLDLWRNMVREYSEELLGRPEHDGSSGQPLDYEVWSFYRDMQRAREAGYIRAYYLGTVCHGLGLGPSILTVVVIDDVVFDGLFRDLVGDNAEGRVIAAPRADKSITGLPFTEETINHFLTHEPIGGTSAACLVLSWEMRECLVG